MLIYFLYGAEGGENVNATTYADALSLTVTLGQAGVTTTSEVVAEPVRTIGTVYVPFIEPRKDWKGGANALTLRVTLAQAGVYAEQSARLSAVPLSLTAKLGSFGVVAHARTTAQPSTLRIASASATVRTQQNPHDEELAILLLEAA